MKSIPVIQFKSDNMAQTPNVPQQARPWNPSFTHADRERWICVYPAYINSKKSIKEGRRLPKDKCVENPSYTEIRDVCLSASMIVGVENKVYPRELEPKDLKYRGRIRIQMRDEDGTLKNEKFPTRESVYKYIAATIPKLKGRLQNQGAAPATSQQQQNTKSQKKKGRKGNK